MSIFSKNGVLLARNGNLYGSCGCWYIVALCPCNACVTMENCADDTLCQQAPEGAWIGTTFIVSHPDAEKAANCVYSTTHPTYGIEVCLYSVVLKGPFSSLSDAEYVLSTFSGTIEDYATGCVCNTACVGDYFGPHHLASTGGGCVRVEEAGGVDDGKDIAYCETGYIAAAITTKGGDYSFRLYNPAHDGYVEIQSTLVPPDDYLPRDILVPPCYSLEMWYCGDPEDFDVSKLSGGFYPVGGIAACSVTTEEWDYVHEPGNDPAGIPSTQEELNDYRCWAMGGTYANGVCTMPPPP